MIVFRTGCNFSFESAFDFFFVLFYRVCDCFDCCCLAAYIQYYIFTCHTQWPTHLKHNETNIGFHATTMHSSHHTYIHIYVRLVIKKENIKFNIKRETRDKIPLQRKNEQFVEISSLNFFFLFIFCVRPYYFIITLCVFIEQIEWTDISLQRFFVSSDTIFSVFFLLSFYTSLFSSQPFIYAL